MCLVACTCLCLSRGGDDPSTCSPVTATEFQPSSRLPEVLAHGLIGSLRGGSDDGPGMSTSTLASKLAAATSAARAKAGRAFHVGQRRSHAHNRELVHDGSSLPGNQSDALTSSRGEGEKGAGGRASFLGAGSSPRSIPRWWWWRQQALQREKDDEFAEILRKARASGDSHEESQEVGSTVLAHNTRGRVLSSGKVVPGKEKPDAVTERDNRVRGMADGSAFLSVKGQGSDVADLQAISDFSCSVRVKRLRKFNEAERLAEMCARSASPADNIAFRPVKDVTAVYHGRFSCTSNGTQTVDYSDSGSEADIGGRGSGGSEERCEVDGEDGTRSGHSNPKGARKGKIDNSEDERGSGHSTLKGARKGENLGGRDTLGRIGKRRKSTTPRVNKGLPKEMWKKVLHRRRCQYYDDELGQCTKTQPLFGDSHEGQAVYCKNHSKMVQIGEDRQQDVRSPRCHFLACRKHPVYGDARLQIAIYCADHRYAHHVDCINRICAHVEGCSRQASFAAPDSRTPIFCLAHKEPHHVNVRSPRCLHYNETTKERCNKQRSFGIKGGPPSYCRAHSNSSLHVNVVSPICQHVLGCAKIPSFGSIEEGQLLFCSRHRQPHHINLRQRNVTADQRRRRKSARVCLHPGCNTRAIFGDPDSRDPAQGRAAVACKVHRLAHHVDLVNRMCQEPGLVCTRRATFGDPPHISSAVNVPTATIGEGGGEDNRQKDGGARRHTSGPVYCRLHRKAGHINLMNKRRCRAPGCKHLASHVLAPNSRATHCSLHKGSDHDAFGLQTSKTAVGPAPASSKPGTSTNQRGALTTANPDARN